MQRDTFTAFNTTFVVDSEYEFVKELGQGTYGSVIAVKHKRTGKKCAIKKIPNINTKRTLTRSCLREIKVLHHFRGHKNIICLYGMDIVFGSDENFNELYLYLEPMEADLQAIIRSGQPLSDAHLQSFIYQTLCGLKYIHSADVLHRDLQPGNLLVNEDCELKICDFGQARGFNQASKNNFLTEYVAMRWYRAPEIMLCFAHYSSSIDMWSVGCILGELLAGKPIFKGKTYVDQLNQILARLGTPSEDTLRRIGSPRAQEYIRSLPIKRGEPFKESFPHANPLALDLLVKMLTFDPAVRISCEQALEHPYLAVWHDPTDEPVCPTKFVYSEEDDSIDDMRKLILVEVNLFRSEVTATTELKEDQRSTIVSPEAIAASPISVDAPLDGITPGHSNDQTPQQGAGGKASANPNEEGEQMRRESDLRVTTIQSHSVSPQRKVEDGVVHARQPEQPDQRIKELEDELDKFRRRAEEQSATILALQKELEKMGDREAQRTQQDEELRALRKRCEQLEEEQISAADSEFVEQMLSDTEGFVSEVSGFSRRNDGVMSDLDAEA